MLAGKTLQAMPDGDASTRVSRLPVVPVSLIGWSEWRMVQKKGVLKRMVLIAMVLDAVVLDSVLPGSAVRVLVLLCWML